MKCPGMNIQKLILSLVVIEMESLAFDMILKDSIYDTLNTLPVFFMLLSGAAFIYSKGLRYTGISVFLGLAIGIVKMNHIFYIEDLSGQGTMNGAYALFNCICKGVSAGFSADAVSYASRRLAQIGKLKNSKVAKEMQERFKI